MVEAACASIVMGNAVTLLLPPNRAELATAFSEALHTSDMPAGIVNVMTGDVTEMLKHGLVMEDVDALYLVDGTLADELRREADHVGAQVLRRIIEVPGASEPANPFTLQRLAEVKTVWMSSGASIGGGGGAY